MKTLTDGAQQPGSYSMLWDGTDDSKRECPAGAYFAEFEAGSYKKTRKLIFGK